MPGHASQGKSDSSQDKLAVTVSESLTGEDQKTSSQISQSEVKDQGNKSSDTKSNTEDSKSSEHKLSTTHADSFKPKE